MHECIFVQRKTKKHNIMNITAGQSAKKQHLSNGAVTSCNRRTSGIGSNDFQSFKWWAEKHPDACCQKCLNRYNEKQNRLNEKNN
jgi:hypothetical protein